MTFEDNTESDWMGPRAVVLARLREELGKDHTKAEALAAELVTMHASLRDHFVAWLKTNTVDMDREVHGWSIRKLIHAGVCSHVATGFTWLSALLDSPEKTLGMLAEHHRGVVLPSARRTG